MFALVFQRLLIEFFLDFLYFPIWWYTGGVRHALLYCVYLVRAGNSILAPGLWLKNIFVPMFGQTDWQGRIMSVFMRLVNVIGRLVALLVWLLVVVVLFLLWIVLPVFVVGMCVIAIT